MKPLVIVGTGLAGYNLAREFRKLDSERPLILITRDDGRNYSKPMLSTGFTKQKTADALAIVVGQQLGTRLPERAIRIGAAATFVVFGAVLVLEGLRG